MEALAYQYPSDEQRGYKRPATPAEQYESLPEGTRAELIRGKIYFFAAPSTVHMRIHRTLIKMIDTYLTGKRCEIFFEHAVQLDPERADTFEPDITVLCDPNKDNGQRIIGAPDMIAEILSPSNSGHDTITKLNYYREAGVPEYWIVDPERRLVTVLTLNDGQYIHHAYCEDDKVKVGVLEDCVIDLSAVFAAAYPPAPEQSQPDEAVAKQ